MILAAPQTTLNINCFSYETFNKEYNKRIAKALAKTLKELGAFSYIKKRPNRKGRGATGCDIYGYSIILKINNKLYAPDKVVINRNKLYFYLIFEDNKNIKFKIKDVKTIEVLAVNN